jgi:predicted NUDIX family phosphoesterase
MASTENLGNFTITIPVSPKESDYTGRRSALFVPKENLLNAGFEQSGINPHVYVTRQPQEVLEAVNENRNFGSRDDVDKWKGLENDPSRQQMIVYTLITSGDNVLLYRRASKGEGDKRLMGNASIGFGGHTGVEDLKDIAILESVGDGEYRESDRHDGSLKSGVTREIEEELRISKEQMDMKVVGAFYEEYSDQELNDDTIPVGAVHTCIIANAELHSDVPEVHLQSDEIASAEWVKMKDLNTKLDSLKNEGVIVENWTSIGSSEFADIMDRNMESDHQILPQIIID